MAREMTCPKCGGGMRTIQRTGVYVEQCRECLGIFLDRGELKLLAAAELEFMEMEFDTTGCGGQQDGGEHGEGGGHGRRRSFLENLFN